MNPTMRMSKKKRASIVLERLAKRYPSPESALTWSTPWELLVATALAAQCTDARVNKVTPAFFATWPTPADLAEAELSDVEEMVRSTGFYRNKAKNLKAAAQRVTQVHAGKVPQTMEELTKLGGVARKTANIVLSNAFGINVGLAVDTHVKRISFRLGLTASTNPVVIEKDLMPLLPQPTWGDFNHYLVLYGREICKARKPLCDACELEDVCPKKGVQAAST